MKKPIAYLIVFVFVFTFSVHGQQRRAKTSVKARTGPAQEGPEEVVQQ